MLGHASCIGGNKGVGGQAVTAKLLSYWTNIDCNTTLGERDPHVTHPNCQNLNMRVNTLQPDGCNIAVVLRLNKI